MSVGQVPSKLIHGLFAPILLTPDSASMDPLGRFNHRFLDRVSKSPYTQQRPNASFLTYGHRPFQVERDSQNWATPRVPRDPNQGKHPLALVSLWLRACRSDIAHKGVKLWENV